MDKMLAMFRTVPGLRILGARHVQQAKNWGASAGMFGTAAAILGVYFCDWKVIVKRIPYYGSKFVDEEEES